MTSAWAAKPCTGNASINNHAAIRRIRFIFASLGGFDVVRNAAFDRYIRFRFGPIRSGLR